MQEHSKTPSSNSTSDTATPMPIPDFYDCLLAEGIETARQMAAIAEAHAKAMAQHVATLEKTIEAARGYRGEQKRLSQALADLAAGRFSTNEVRADLDKTALQSAIEAIGKAVPVPIAEPVKQTFRDKILDHYAATGDHYSTMAWDNGLIPASVNEWLREARSKGDQRAAAGDLRRGERDSEEEANLRAFFRWEGTSKTGLLMPTDDAIGVNLADLNAATGDVATEEGTANVPPYWIKAIECLNDQRQVGGADLIEAGSFSSELALLRELRKINEKLAEAKLYILADSTHYQLCRLL